jgi:prepilin-type N-terminal cleavage/methylation domain-containing protein
MNKDQRGFSIPEILIVVLVIVIVCSMGYKINKNVQSKNNQKYFSQLTLTTQEYYEHQSEALGIKASDEALTKRCYQTGQGPFDDGYLACGIEISRKVQVEPNESLINELLGKFTSALKQDGFVIVGGRETVGANGASFSAGRYNTDPHCTTDISYLPNSAYADAKTSMEYNLRCSKDASAIPNGFSYTPLR